MSAQAAVSYTTTFTILPRTPYLCGMPTPLFHVVTTALQAAAEPDFQARQQGYSKEPIQTMGVRTATMRLIAKEHFPKVKQLPLEAFWVECTALLEAGTVEQRGIAFTWAHARRKDLQPVHFEVLYGWLCRYVTNWAACDQLCNEVFGDFMMRYPAHATHVLDWARSENRWLRRAAAVILIPDLKRKGTFVPLLLQVATILLPDRDDLVQKGYGWALKEAFEDHHDKVWPFIQRHKQHMSRTALRYAIEKLGPAQKAEAMHP